MSPDTGIQALPSSWAARLIATMPSAMPCVLKRASAPIVLASSFHLPHAKDIDARLLIGGSAIFGVGWGIAGLLPRRRPAGAGHMVGSEVVLFVSAQ